MAGASHSRIGVFGGTFDPVHNTHCDIARAAVEEARLDRVFFVVAARPPHKTDGAYATPEQRLAMVQAATAELPRMEASALEVHRDGPSYTVDTLRELKALYPGADLHLIIGLDSLIDLPTWRSPEEIMRQAHLLVVPRPAGPRQVPEELTGRYTLLPFEETALSATEVRERIMAGEPFGHLVPPAVERLIREEGIYHAHHGNPPC